MLLAIDIGNTTISFALMEKLRVLSLSRAVLDGPGTAVKGRINKVLRELGRRYAFIDDVIICSVIPDLTRLIKPLIAAQFHFEPVIAGRHVRVPIKNRYKDPNQVGQDRLVGAYAAKILYGQPAVVIDLGTAVTFDIISEKGDYEGGMIAPGINMATESLHNKTALLPKVNIIRSPAGLIGKDTENSILSGIFYGYAAMCEGLVARIQKKLKKKPKVVLTGGYSPILKKYLTLKGYKHDVHLVFKGLALIYAEAGA